MVEVDSPSVPVVRAGLKSSTRMPEQTVKNKRNIRKKEMDIIPPSDVSL
jgi:hypothetical protein